MTDKIVVFSTTSSAEDAETIARHLVEQHLAACVSIVREIRSIYRWEGKIEAASEWLLLIKSSRDRFEALRQLLEKLHTYEVPEVIALPVVEGSRNYLN